MCSKPTRTIPFCLDHISNMWKIPPHSWSCIDAVTSHMNSIPWDQAEHNRTSEVITTVCRQYVQHEMIGQRICKPFENPETGEEDDYYGTIVSMDFDTDYKHMFKVQYDKPDGDDEFEDMYLDEIYEFII